MYIKPLTHVTAFTFLAFNYFVLPPSARAQSARIYKGIDPNGSEVVPLSRWPNSTRARLNFLKNLGRDVGGQDFEDVPVGETSVPDPVRLPFNKPGRKPLIGELSGGDGTNFSVEKGSTYKGNYGTSPRRFWSIVTGSGGNFKIDFDKPISAFAFNGIDIGDFDGVLEVSTFRKGKLQRSFKVPLAPGEEAYGSVLFYGIIEDKKKNKFDSIQFQSFDTGALSDIFSFDDMVAALYPQISNQYKLNASASLQPYAANPQLVLDSTASYQRLLVSSSGKCDRDGWVLDDIDLSSPQFQYLHGKTNADWRFCVFGEGGQEISQFTGNSQYGGFNVDSTFFRAGIEARISNHFVLGGAYGYASPDLNDFQYDRASGNVANSISLGSLYATYLPSDSLRITVLGTVGTSYSQAFRDLDYSSSLSAAASSRWNGSVRGFMADFTYEYLFDKKKTRTSPAIVFSANYNWSRISNPSFSESGTGQLVSLDPYTVDSNILGLGLSLEYPIKMDSDGMALFIPRFYLDYGFDFTGSDQSLYTVNALETRTAEPLSSSALLYGSNRLRAALFGDINLGDSFTLYFGTSYLWYNTGSGYVYEGGVRVRI